MSKNGNEGMVSKIDVDLDYLISYGEKSGFEPTTRAHPPGFGTLVDETQICSANSSIAATMGTRAVEMVWVNRAGKGSSQPERGVTQDERDDLLRGVGSQFDCVPKIGLDKGVSAAGHESQRENEQLGGSRG
ncbi:hypothetical protein J7T55_005216 [Diaporthe amygdali]|uniref:uncharacterized protein n=1 Tax=Phomopsis amygdali TaxID=1214568 RepID=UPI0022FEC5CA|nr:uncharacterized protein J7T55_005216 [Diaporthe amygdali]KAJ0116270.1 hypothetical protein J7T55_005216 [Diaporthe amygdali]